MSCVGFSLSKSLVQVVKGIAFEMISALTLDCFLSSTQIHQSSLAWPVDVTKFSLGTMGHVLTLSS